jgi:hypothetical protein
MQSSEAQYQLLFMKGMIDKLYFIKIKNLFSERLLRRWKNNRDLRKYSESVLDNSVATSYKMAYLAIRMKKYYLSNLLQKKENMHVK